MIRIRPLPTGCYTIGVSLGYQKGQRLALFISFVRWTIMVGYEMPTTFSSNPDNTNAIKLK